MTRNANYSDMISGLEAKIEDLRIQRDELTRNLDAELDALQTALDSLRLASGRVSISGNSIAPSAATLRPNMTRPALPRPQPSVLPRVSKKGRSIDAAPPPTQPFHGETPLGVPSGWISMVASEASPYALSLAILRDFPREMITSAELNNRLKEVRGVEGGVGYTVLEPLQKTGIIEGDHTKWTIKDRSKGGIITAAGYLWADPKYLNVYDWAAIRREATIILLNEHPRQTNAAISKGLRSARWLEKAPITPHLVKADLRYMSRKDIVRQIETTKEWELVPNLSGILGR